MKSKLPYSLLFFINTFLLFAQQEPFICGTVENISAVHFSPLNNSAYSGSVDPEYLGTFDPISFDIYFWIINPENENISYTPVTYQHILENLKRTNELFKPMGICFVLKGYDFFESDAIYTGANLGQINSYANANGKVSANSFNVYIPESLSSGNGVTNFESNRLAIKRSHFIGYWELSPGNVLAHELAHDFNLRHPWGGANSTITTQEHVTRDSNDPNYNALSVADFIHDTPAMVSFWTEANHFGLSIFDIIDVNTCNYTGSLTDALGVPFGLTPADVGNVMGYTWQPCITTGFTIGQGIRIREYIADPVNASKPSILAMRNNNPGIDLYIKDSPEDFGEEPNIASPYTWSSPDIWVRHQEDYIYQHQNPEYHPTNPNYVHIKITNRGCDTTIGDEQLKLYWSKAATSLSWDYHWDNNNTFDNGALVGSEIGTLILPPINPNEEIIVVFPWSNMPNPSDYNSINDQPWHFCLLARIVSDNDPMAFSETSILGNNVRNNNNIAQKNVTIVDLEPNTAGKPIGGVIAIGNIFSEPRKYSLEFVADNREIGKKIFEEAEVSIKLDAIFLEAWVKGGKQGTNVILRGDDKLIIIGDNAKLENIDFEPHKIGTLNLMFNFLTKEITDKEEYAYHVIQKDDLTGMIIGGETYEIRKYPRGLFYANAGEDKQTDKNTSITLNAEMINEPAVYNWYDNEGNLIYEGTDFTIFIEVGKKYKLEVIALSDGYKDYAEVEVTLKPNTIITFYPNPTSDQVTVAYKINEGDSAYLSVNMLYDSNNISHNYVLNIEENEITLDISNYPNGFYSVALITNGEISDTTTLIKQ